LLGVLLAPSVIVLDYLARISLTPFLVIGCVSLISTYLPPRYQLIVIPLIYAPALTSLGVLILDQRPQYLIELASGYILSIPILSIFSLAKAQGVKNTVFGYLTSLASSYFIWVLVAHSGGEGGQLFLTLIKMLTLSQGFGRVEPPQVFAPLSALSSVALLTHTWSSRDPMASTYEAAALVYAVASSSLVVALVVIYSLAYTDSVAIGLASSAMLTIALTIRLGVLTRRCGG